MRNASPRRRRPELEALEERALLSAAPTAWPDPGHLTFSLAPDGTSIGGVASDLGPVLGPAGSPARAVALTTVLKGLQSWAVLGPINIGLVADAGAEAGGSAAPQGRAGQGALRLSARPLAPSAAALTTPFDPYGSWSGNLVLNGGRPYGDGTAGTTDLFATALREAGRVLGLSDSTDPSSAMHPVNAAGRSGPSAADASALRALYGLRAPDSHEGTAGNETLWTATPLACLTSAGGSAIEADLTSADDLDTFVVTAPADGGGFSVVVRASGLSLLTPSLSVFDALGQPVTTVSTTVSLANDLSAAIAPGLAGATYYVRVAGARADVFGIGSYRVAAGTPALAQAAVASPPTPAPSTGLSAFLSQATAMPSHAAPNGSGWTALARDTIASPTAADTFRVLTGPAGSSVLRFEAWSDTPGGLTPRVDVYDAQGAHVPSQLLHHDAERYTVQVPTATANTWYVARVAALEPTGAHATGGYALSAEQGAAALPRVPFVSGALSAAQPRNAYVLDVSTPTTFRLDLSTRAGTAGQGTVGLAIFNAQQQPVATLLSTAGGPAATTQATLAPGRYDLRVAADSTSLPTGSLLLYTLRGLAQACGVGPMPIDTSLYPVGPTPTCLPNDPYIISRTDPNLVTWLLDPLDPFRDVWRQ